MIVRNGKIAGRRLVRAILRGGFVVAWLGLLAHGCTPEESRAAPDRRVVVLGFDGLDPQLLNALLAEGALPNFARLTETGTYRKLGTSMPPQSPVAWSTFITGMDPGGHGIFDFLHRDPAPDGGGAIRPYLSTSQVEEGESLEIGDWAIPLQSGEAKLLRKGKAFWNVLADEGVPATLVKIPANFPPEPSQAETLSDMGTPDIRGTYGIFTYFTSDPLDGDSRSVSGGRIERVRVRNGHARGMLEGPKNPFDANGERVSVPVDVWVDRESRAAKVSVGGEERVLNEGEWTEWLPVRFEFLPLVATVPGMVRVHLSEVSPHVKLYVSPVNLDPEDPALPISTPEGYAAELARRAGDYYTQGIPEDTAALSAGALPDEGFLEQADIIFRERVRLLEAELERFREGLLFVYFGGSDQVAHMFWRTLEGGRPEAVVKEGNPIREVYEKLDRVLGRVLEEVDERTTLLVLSDHGFAPYAKHVHLNAWLRDEGFLALRGSERTSGELFSGVDWTRTKAYGLGLNSLYLNLEGREKYGVVRPGEREELIERLEERLLAWTDPDTGEKVVEKVYRREDVYSPDHRGEAPDLLVGYRRGYRVSEKSALGGVPEKVLERNEKKWSGDHCVAAELVPGVLLTNRFVADRDLSLVDVAPTILAELGVTPIPEMTGKDFLVGESRLAKGAPSAGK